MSGSPRNGSPRNGSPRNSLGNVGVRSDMDAVYPEPMSILNRHMVIEWCKPLLRNRRNERPRNRFRTQPVTFDEIQEVDEETSILDTKNSDVEAIPSKQTTAMDREIYQLSNALKAKLKPLGNEAGEDAGKDAAMEGKALEKKRRMDKNREGSV